MASGAVVLPWDITLGAVVDLRSSLPFSARAGRDLNSDGANTDYVPGTAQARATAASILATRERLARARSGLAPDRREPDRQQRYNSVDVRVSKAFALGGRSGWS